MEKDLIDIADYIELCDDNFDVYGPRLARFILSVGVELDAALSVLLNARRNVDGAAAPKEHNMGAYKRILSEIARE